MKQRWQRVEDQVRDVASRIYGRECKPAVIAGNAIDGVVDIDPTQRILVEITINCTLEKVRADVNKLVLARTHLFSGGVLARCFLVLDREPTPAMVAGGADVHITVLSNSSFAASFIEYEKYRSVRREKAFGSAIDPKTGDPDPTAYIPVTYTAEGSSKSLSPEAVAELLVSGKDVVLLGEYGSGKSRCVSEIFDAIAKEWGSTFQFPFAINLRECWGLRRAEELVRRHLFGLGLDAMAASAMRVYNRKNALFLLDGFDEIGTQSWTADDAKLRLLRAQALEGVKDIVTSSGTGTLIAGREHYFSSRSEMLTSLGLEEKTTTIIYAREEFSVNEMIAYFEAADITMALPEWLPRRPLICQTIAKLDPDSVDEMFGLGSSEANFWNHFIEVICERDSRIHPSFDASNIFGVFLELARATRGKPANVGPITQRELQDAFTAAVGHEPLEDASVMLQRLPTLGRTSADSADRQFIDTYILDGLRARDVGRLPDIEESKRKAILSQTWANPLGTLGQVVLADLLLSGGAKFTALMKRGGAAGNSTLTADLASSFLRLPQDIIDFEGLSILGASFSTFDLSASDVRNLTVEDSTFEVLVLPNSPPSNTKIVTSIATSVAGVSSLAGLPKWVQLIEVGTFDSVQTVARIRNAGLSDEQEILVAIIKKTFFQRGAGRKEEALLRGFSSGPAQKAAPRILSLLKRENVLTSFKGNDGDVYAPVRAQTGRMGTLLSELRSSKDPLWAAVSAS